MSTEIIKTDETHPAVFRITTAFAAETELILAQSALINKVATDDANKAAARAMAEIKRINGEIERERKALKAPVIELGRAIDKAADMAAEPLGAELRRLAGVTLDYAREVQRKKDEAEAKAREEQDRIEREKQAELDRIENERLATERKARMEREAEDRARREAAEAQAKAARDEAEKARILAKAEADRIKAEADAKAAEEAAQREADAKRREIEARASVQMEIAAPVVAEAPKGQRVKREWKWEVTNVYDLVRCHPGMVKIEPRASEIDLAISAMASNGQAPKIPGLRIWEEDVLKQAASRGGKVLEA